MYALADATPLSLLLDSRAEHVILSRETIAAPSNRYVICQRLGIFLCNRGIISQEGGGGGVSNCAINL